MEAHEVLLPLLLIFLSNLLMVTGTGGGEIEDNAYKNILINVDPGVEESDALLEKIEAAFEEASKLLYQASGRRFYLGEITIMLPSSWTHRDFYEEIGRESAEHQDFLIRASKSSPTGDVPFAVKVRNANCGQPGDYVHLTTGFFINDTGNSLQKMSKTLVHEWGHLRYGVYDEYPTAKYPVHFYSSQSGKIEATRCSDKIEGEWYNIDTGATGENACKINGTLPEAACRFIPYSDNTVNEPYGSLMSYQFLSQINVFCSDDARAVARHNTEAPTEQNKFCKGKSVWEVIQEHSDYQNNLPRTIDNVKPNFRFVMRKLPKRFVLLLDVSGSMRDQDRIEKLRQGAHSFINQVIEDGTLVSVVLFNHGVTVVKPLTLVDKMTRNDLINSLPARKDCGGATAIRKGLREAIKVSEIDGEAMGSNIVLVSDGEETENEPPLQEIRQELADKKVVVHSVAITQNADHDIDVVANQTGGLSFLFASDSRSKSLFSAFKRIGDSQKESGENLPQILRDHNLEVLREKPVASTFSVDQQMNRNLLVVSAFSEAGVMIELESPNNHRYDLSDSHFTCKSEFNICEFFHENPDIGKWEIKFSTSRNQRVTYTVRGESSEEYGAVMAAAVWNKDTISMSPDSDSKAALQVLVQQNYNPVENAKVTAAVQLPEGNQAMITLADDGIGADSIGNDGIYSANFIDFTLSGARYSAEVFVEGTDLTVINKNAVVGLGAKAADDKADKRVSTGHFTRSTISQSIKLDSIQRDPSGKIYPPDRIKDLTLVRYNETDYTVTLEWSAVGAQLLLGKASEYELRYGPGSKRLRNNFTDLPLVTYDMLLDDTTTDLMKPGDAKSKERVSIALPKDQTFYSFGVVAVDKEGRVSRGEVSNTVAVSFVLYLESPEPKDISVAIIAACVAFIVVVGVIVGIVFFVKWKLAKRPDDKKASSPPEAPEPPPFEEEKPATPPPCPPPLKPRKPINGVQVM